MYSTLAIRTNSKKSGRIVGTHQKLDKVAYKIFVKKLRKDVKFPDIKMILNFEGNGGPDGLKRKSPGQDEPMHFILPDKDDGSLIKMIEDHQYNLKKALKKGDEVRAAFEAAWMAHAVTDGLTPAHHFPLAEAKEELMTEKDFVKVFGVPVKGIMHGASTPETLRNNWLYWGSDGYMSKHIAFEYGVAITMTTIPPRRLTPKITPKEFKNAEIHEVFYSALEKISKLDMYTRFRRNGWTTDLALETKNILIPEIIKAITLCWMASIPEEKKNEK